MREFKFRAWDKENNTRLTREQLKSEADFSWFADENLFFMQSTGLKDKNGVEIYEGDLVRVAGIFPDGLLKVWFRNGMYHVGNWNMQGFMNTFDFYEVVGNIYENPELLEVEEWKR